MVRTLDPERFDVSQLIRTYLNKLNPFSSGQQHLPLEQQKVIVGLLLQEEKYSNILASLKKMSGKPLTVIFKSDCSDSSKYSSEFKNLARFQGSCDPRTQELSLCTSLMKSEIDLKRNLDRELTLIRYAYPSFYKHSKFVSGDVSDSEFAKTAFVACRESMKDYFIQENQIPNSAQKKNFKESTEICATYLTRYRAPNADQEPLDVWIRHSRQLMAQNKDIFNLNNLEELDLGYQ